MRMLYHAERPLVVVAMALAVLAAGCSDPIVPSPPAKVVFENALFRILDVDVPPGTTLKHTYQNDVAAIAMLDGARTRMHGAGGDWGAETNTALGSVVLGAAGEHGVHNVGETAFRLFALEKLRNSGQPAGEVGEMGMTQVAESDGFRAFEVKLTDAKTQVHHTHTVPAVTVLVTGKVLSQGPESKETDIGQAPTGLKQLDQPGQWLFVPPGQPHYVVPPTSLNWSCADQKGSPVALQDCPLESRGDRPDLLVDFL
jgi:hypothetical protein